VLDFLGMHAHAEAIKLHATVRLLAGLIRRRMGNCIQGSAKLFLRKAKENRISGLNVAQIKRTKLTHLRGIFGRLLLLLHARLKP
jgi:hypothetical protein